MRHLTKEEINIKLKDFIIIDEYVKMNDFYKFKCKKCGNIKHTSLRSILYQNI